MYQVAWHKQQFNDNGQPSGVSPYPSFKDVNTFGSRDDAANSVNMNEPRIESEGGYTAKYWPRVWRTSELSQY